MIIVYFRSALCIVIFNFNLTLDQFARKCSTVSLVRFLYFCPLCQNFQIIFALPLLSPSPFYILLRKFYYCTFKLTYPQISEDKSGRGSSECFLALNVLQSIVRRCWGYPLPANIQGYF